MNKNIVIINGTKKKYISRFLKLSKSIMNIDSFSLLEIMNKVVEDLDIDINSINNANFLKELKELILKYNIVSEKTVCEYINKFYKNNFNTLFLYIGNSKIEDSLKEKYDIKTLYIKDVSKNNYDYNAISSDYDYVILNTNDDTFDYKSYEMIRKINEIEKSK